MAGVAQKVFDLIRPTVEAQGVSLWDVRFVKEGASYYLRVYLDAPQGISIDDCTRVSHAIDPILDEADPIEQSYYLEVCSPGLGRELTRPEHREQFLGAPVTVRLFRAIDGKKELSGLLGPMGEEGLHLQIGQTDTVVPKAQISKILLVEDL